MKFSLRRTLLAGLFGVLVLAGPAPVVAQSAARITFEHDGDGATGFALYAESGKGKPLRVDLGVVAADSEGKRVAAVPRLPDGSYTLSVAAYNTAGESVRVPAAPAHVVVKTETASAPTTKGTIDKPPVTQSATPSSADTAPQKSGALSRFWKILVGED